MNGGYVFYNEKIGWNVNFLFVTALYSYTVTTNISKILIIFCSFLALLSLVVERRKINRDVLTSKA